jgi:hypothetical protein
MSPNAEKIKPRAMQPLHFIGYTDLPLRFIDRINQTSLCLPQPRVLPMNTQRWLLQVTNFVVIFFFCNVLVDVQYLYSVVAKRIL